MIGAGLVRNFAGQINTIKAAVLAALSGNNGAALVGSSDGTTVQARLVALATASAQQSAALAAGDGAGLVGFSQPEAGAVPRSLLLKGREVITPEDFGAVGDGVTDDTAALVRFYAAVQGRIGALGPKTYFQAGRIASAFASCTLVGVPGKTRIVSAFNNAPLNPEQAGFLQLLDVSDFHVIGVEFASTLVSAPLDTGSALVFSYQSNVKNCSFRHCKFTAANANTSGLSFFTRVDANDLGATIDGLWIEDCDFYDLGSTASTIMNRSTDLTAAQRVFFNRNHGKNLGLSGSFGFLVSFDGYGQHFTCDDNLVENAYGIGIEDTFWSYGTFHRNSFGDFRAGRAFAPMSFSGSMHGLSVKGNRTLQPSATRCNFIGVSNSRFRDNYLQAAGDYAFHTRGGSGNLFDGDTYKSNGIHAALIGSNTVATSDNRWNRCMFDTSAAAALSAVVRFDGASTTRNLVEKCTLLKGTGGTLTDGINGALGNVVEDYADATNPTASKYVTVALPDADFTFASRDQIVRYRAYRFQGPLTASRVINFPAGLTQFDAWNDTANELTLLPAGGSGFILFPGQRVRVVSNGPNLQGWGALGASWNNTQGVLTLGEYRLWVDAAGRLRIKNGAPTADADGAVVGTQA